MIRVLLADDHPTTRAGLIQLLGGIEDIEVVGTAADGEQAVALAAELEPDVVLMDLQMPTVDGIEATRRIADVNGRVHTVILTSFSDRERILEALDAGAVLRDRLARGQMEATLTTREREVLGLVAQGLPNKLIARRLGISEKTVKAHLTKIFETIGVTDRTQAALWAERHGFVS